MKLFHFIPTGHVNPTDAKPGLIKTKMPDWYKRAELTFKKKEQSVEIEVGGLRTCLPFLDAMTAGFCLVTPVDIEFSLDKDGNLRASWDKSLGYEPLNFRDYASGRTLPRPVGFSDVHYAWASQWGWQVPKGYSVLVTHPLNRFDLPFQTTSGIADSDMIKTHGNIPFFLKEGFIGVIPAGTPIAQLIPIKRHKWVHVLNYVKVNKTKKESEIIGSTDHYYRDNLRQKKEYK